MTNHCPFCGNYAYAAPVGDAYRLDCRYCEIQVEITKRAYSSRCPNPVAVLDFIREKMKVSTRPRVDLADMKRSGAPLTHEDEMPKRDQKQTLASDADDDMLTNAAKAIGTTLGKMAVKTGIATPVPAAKAPRKVAAKKKAPAVKRAASKRSAAKPPHAAKGKKATSK
jgi:hypothetical protein